MDAARIMASAALWSSRMDSCKSAAEEAGVTLTLELCEVVEPLLFAVGQRSERRMPAAGLYNYMAPRHLILTKGLFTQAMEKL